MSADLDFIQITPRGLSGYSPVLRSSSHFPKGAVGCGGAALVNGQVPGHVETVSTEALSPGQPRSHSHFGHVGVSEFRNLERRISSLETKLESMENRFGGSLNEILSILKNTRRKDTNVTPLQPGSSHSTTTSV